MPLPVLCNACADCAATLPSKDFVANPCDVVDLTVVAVSPVCDKLCGKAARAEDVPASALLVCGDAMCFFGDAGSCCSALTGVRALQVEDIKYCKAAVVAPGCLANDKKVELLNAVSPMPPPL